MNSRDWIELLQKIPSNLQECLLFSTASGLEICAQSILQYGDNHVLVRGRQGGTPDAGRVFCVPYAQITYVMFSREMKDPDLRGIFGELISAPEPPPLELEDTPPLSAETEPAPPAIAPPAKPTEPPRPSLRERLRSRLGLTSSNLKKPG